MTFKIQKVSKSTTVVNARDVIAAFQLAGLETKGTVTVSVRCDRGEIPLDDKAQLVISWVEGQ